jgi:hypothetical protein
MERPRISKKAKIDAGKIYLKTRGIYWKNYLKAGYIQAIDRLFGEGNYDAKVFFRNKVRNAKKSVADTRREINKEIKAVEDDLYLLRIAEKQEVIPEEKKRISSAIANNLYDLKMLNETKYIATTKQLALSSRETRKRLRSSRKYKKKFSP